MGKFCVFRQGQQQEVIKHKGESIKEITMNKLLLIGLGFCLWSCSTGQKAEADDNGSSEGLETSANDTLFRFSVAEYEMGEAFGYVNQKGDTIIPFNKYVNSYSDTIIDFGIVMEKIEDRYEWIGINQKGQRLYQIYPFDNGPDYVSDGLFRIVKDGKIGYADSTGKIVIPPTFACAYPFSNGEAKVSLDCVLEKDQEHTIPKSDNWFNIDKTGQKIE